MPDLLPITLTPAAFHQSVLDVSPSIAVFDCDGTLWSGDAGSAFMHWTIETGLVSRSTAAWIDEKYRGYLRGDVSELDICGQMVQMYHGLRESELRSAARVFFAARIEKNIFPEMLKLVDELRARNVQIWAVSSTNDWVIEEGVQRFGIPPSRVLAAKVHCDRTHDASGIITDTLLDVPTDDGKAVSLLRAGVPSPDAVFGNSIHDAAMLAMARRAFPINPSPDLLEYSARQGWPVFYPTPATP